MKNYRYFIGQRLTGPFDDPMIQLEAKGTP